MRCIEARKHLDAFRTGEIPFGTSRKVAGHISECNACANELAATKSLALQFRDLKVRAPRQILEKILMDTADRYARVETGFGEFWVAYSAQGISNIEPSAGDGAAFEEVYLKRMGRRVKAGDIPARFALAVRQAVSGVKPVSTGVDLSASSEFERKVLLLLRRIPRGEVRPYAWLAREAGSPKAVRAVGNALARNPVPFILPCHRVVPSSGGIGQYALGSAMKRGLLEREDAPVAHIEEFARKSVHYLGSRTTGVYCLPTCHAARRIRDENVIAFHTLDDVRAVGFRPCRRCRPN